MQSLIQQSSRLLGVACVYLLAAKVGLMYAVVGSTVTLVWAPSGIALAAVLAFGPRMLLGVAAGAFVANVWSDLPAAAAAGIALGNTLECATGAFLLVRLAGFRNTLPRTRDVFALIGLAAAVATSLSALVGTAALELTGTVTAADYGTVWLKWWLGDMMGVLVVAPPLLVWLGRSRTHFSTPRVAEIICLVLALVAVNLQIFGAPELAEHGYYPASLAVFPFIIWGALRFGQRGASLVTLITALLAIWGTTNGTGPFVVAQPVDSLVRWCAFAIVVAVTGLLLAAAVAEQRRAQAALRSAFAELEQRVAERTRELSGRNAALQREMAERLRLETALIRTSEEQQQTIGRELHDGLGQHLTSLALFSASLEQQLQEQGRPEADAARRIVAQINHATVMTQNIARGLYPAELEFGGLVTALAQLAADTQRLQGLHCSFHAEVGAQQRNPLLDINLYRIAQEAVNNAVKYSRADHLRIALVWHGAEQQLSVTDDGIGIDLALIHDTPGANTHRPVGLGMHSMRHRASLLGGRLEIVANRPRGTVVSVHYPEAN